MSPLCKVSTLQTCCVGIVLREISRGLIHGHKQILHKYLIATLHVGIRQQLIEMAVTTFHEDLYVLTDVIGVLTDSSIRRIEPRPGKPYFSPGQSEAFFNRLEESSATGLHELIVKVELPDRAPVSQGVFVSNSIRSLHNLLTNGLAQNLRVLVLRAVCDNQVLTILGQHAVHLTFLDISSNWFVDDIGIRNLVLKDSANLSIPVEVDNCESCAQLHELAAIPESSLTASCYSLQEVRIQDTNTSAMSLFTLLLFIKNLKSLGGFIYYRNIGDAILAVQPHRPVLELTDLWDMHLPPDKVAHLSLALPKLTTLYTRASQLLQGMIAFDDLTNVTIDFDFAHISSEFTDFLNYSGKKLKKLILIDQAFCVDLTVIAECCPLLTELEAKVLVGDSYPNAMLPYLKFARLRINSGETFKWLMLRADVLQHLKVIMEVDEELPSHVFLLDHKVIADLAQCQPPSFDTIECLSIFLANSFVGNLDSDSVRLLVSSCKRLRYLDDLQTWCKIREADILRVVSEMVQSNWDIEMRYQGISLTNFYKKNSPAETVILN